MIPRIYIGTEPRMWLATEVLKYSIRKYASSEVEIIEMDYSLGGDWTDWDMGREPGNPATRTHNPKTGGAVWFTDFSSFRYFIPEANNFEGKAIYLDFDQVVLGDIMELFNTDMEDHAVLSLTSRETSVLLYDCAKFKNLDWWLYGDDMKQSGYNPPIYNALWNKHQRTGQLPVVWNCLDGSYLCDRTKLVHYTAMNSQPHRPYPEKLNYVRHPVPKMEEIWFDIFYEMIGHGLIDVDKLSQETAFLEFEKQISMEYALHETN